MAARSPKVSRCALNALSRPFNGVSDPVMQCLAPRLSRSMATEASIPSSHIDNAAFAEPPPLGESELVQRAALQPSHVLATLYKFPTMEPTRFLHYPSSLLDLPLRRDILHRAVIFEGDATRQGTASTKWRDDVRGSGRKIRPQKGMGMARLGDKKSPMLRGGGVAFGPHPRDFATKLPRKIYDLAWRTALSYRYRRGELIIIENETDLEMAEPRWLEQILNRNHIGKEDGRSLIVTKDHRPNLFTAFSGLARHGKARTSEDVDVKNLLESGRIIMEKDVLDWIFKTRRSDLNRKVPTAVR